MKRKPSLIKAEDTPFISAIAILTLSLSLFGADAPASSFLISLITLVATAIFVIIFPDMRPRLSLLPYVAAWIALALTHWLTGRLADGEHEYLMLITGGCFFWIGRYGAQSRRRQARLQKLVIVFCLIVAFLSFFQHFITPGLTLGAEKPYHKGRLTGPFLSSNTTATFFGIMLLFAVFRLFSLSRQRIGGIMTPSAGAILFSKPVTASATLVLATCLLLTGSRAGFAATSLSFVVLLFGTLVLEKSNAPANKASLRSLVSTVCLIGFSFFAIWMLSGSLVETRLATVADDIEARRAMFEASWRAGEFQPLLGFGLDGIVYGTEMMSTAETNRHIVAQSASHNLYAQWFAQAGWPGLIGLVAVTGAFFIWIYRSRTSWPQKFFSFSILCLVLTHGIFDYALEIPAVFLLLSLLLGLHGGKAGYTER